jgi:hypothetical protein
MRSPSPTFRDALKSHRQWLRTLPKWKRRIANEVIVRWIDHPECESIWVTVCSHLKVQVTPDRFIAEIISTRLAAEPLDAKPEAFKGKMHALTNKLSREERYQELADRNQDFATTIAKYEHDREQVERAGILGRKSPGRMFFMRQVSAGFTQWCGQPLDDVVRVLTDIAFDTEVTTEAVRGARNPRPKRDRGIRHPK